MKLCFATIVLFLTCSVNAQQKLDIDRMFNETHRHATINAKKDFYAKNAKFSYVYKNGSPYGKNAVITYDDFYKKYKVSFIKENGSKTGCTLTDGNFIYSSDPWKFKYNGNVYRLTN